MVVKSLFLPQVQRRWSAWIHGRYNWFQQRRWREVFTAEKVSKQPKTFLKLLLQHNLPLSCPLYAEPFWSIYIFAKIRLITLLLHAATFHYTYCLCACVYDKNLLLSKSSHMIPTSLRSGVYVCCFAHAGASFFKSTWGRESFIFRRFWVTYHFKLLHDKLNDFTQDIECTCSLSDLGQKV